MEDQVLPTKLIFCAKDQEETPHAASVDGNGEFVFTCTTPDCGRFVKLPADVTPEDAQAYFAAHKESNVGQVSLEEQERKLLTLLDAETPESTEPANAAPGDTEPQE